MEKNHNDHPSNAQYILYLGCTVPVRALNYEISARKVAEKLGLYEEARHHFEMNQAYYIQIKHDRWVKYYYARLAALKKKAR